MKLPRRVFLDTNVVNFVLDHSEHIFDGAAPSLGLSEADLADLHALHLIFLCGERAHWELAVSPLTYTEIAQTPNERRRAALKYWFNEVWQQWRVCFAEDDRLSDAHADDLASRMSDSGILDAFPDDNDRVLICHAIAYDCDAFCTRDRKTILKRVQRNRQLPLEIISPREWGNFIRSASHGF